jgi:hypothetical protein
MTDRVRVHDCTRPGEKVPKHCTCPSVSREYAETLVADGVAAWHAVPRSRWHSTVILTGKVSTFEHTFRQNGGGIGGEVLSPIKPTGEAMSKGDETVSPRHDDKWRAQLPKDRPLYIQGHGRIITGGYNSKKISEIEEAKAASSRVVPDGPAPIADESSERVNVNTESRFETCNELRAWCEYRQPMKRCEVTLVCFCGKSVDRTLNVFDDASTPPSMFMPFTCVECTPHGQTGERHHENRRRGQNHEGNDIKSYPFGKTGVAVKHVEWTTLPVVSAQERFDDAAEREAEADEKWNVYAEIH